MGLFISLSGVMGKDAQQVEASVRRFTQSVNGGFDKGIDIEDDHPNLSIIGQKGQNAAILYPNDFVEWDDASAFLSRNLQTSVFSFHIHDEDLWMFQLFHNGELVSRYNPIPDYWQEDLSETEAESWKGDAEIISNYVPGLQAKDIDKYFVRWDWDDDYEGEEKAYPQDEFEYGDCWQLVDFMEKIGLEYPIDELGEVKGTKYKLWTKQLKLEE